MSTARKIGFGMLAALTLALVLVVLVLLVSWRRDAAAELVSVTQLPATPRIGETVRIEGVIRLPWHRRPTAAPLVELPDGLKRGRDGKPEIVGYGAGSVDWRVQLELIPVDFGPFAAFSASMPLTTQRDGGDSVLELPIAEIAPEARYGPEEEAAIAFAGALAIPEPEPEVPPRWPWILTAVVAILLLLGLLLRRRKDDEKPAYVPPPPPPWEIAERELQALEEALPMAADAFFVRLVDLLRQYLERAFHLPATEQTTVEFLQAMQNAPDLLSTEHRNLLEDVIGAADIVKFARTDASDEQMRAALAKARSFVSESSEALRRKPSGEVANHA